MPHTINLLQHVFNRFKEPRYQYDKKKETFAKSHYPKDWAYGATN